MADKTNFLLYKDNKSAVLDLTDENAGKLFKAIYCWVNGREEYAIDDIGTKAIFEYVFKKHLEKDLIKYKEIVERNRLNGNKGGRPKTQKTQSVSEKPKKGDNDIDIDTDIDNGNDKDIETYKEIFNYWNSKKIIVHRKMTNDITKALVKTLRIYSSEEIMKYIDRYNTIINDENYYFNNIWSLEMFLKQKNAIKEFTDEGSKWNDYQNRKQCIVTPINTTPKDSEKDKWEASW